MENTTYFQEREERLLKEIEAAKAELDEASARFGRSIADLTTRRDVILAATVKLRNAREDMETRTKALREQAVLVAALVVTSETLTANLSELLAEPLGVVAKIEAEIKSLEDQLARKSDKPKHKVEQLQTRLSSLRFRRELAEKQAVKPKSDVMVNYNREVELAKRVAAAEETGEV